jgi:hypothetical protein
VKRTLAITLVLVLVLSLAFPAMALAKRGGVPANDKAKPNAASVASEEEQAPVDAENNGKDKDKQKDKQESGEVEDGDEAATDPGKGKDKDRDRDGSDEASGTAEPKLTGVENALSRLQRNLERMQAQLEAGKRDSLPEGLQSAIAKFMSWLGIDPASEEAENTDEGSTETSGTVEPEPVEDDEPDTGADEVLEESAEE